MIQETTGILFVDDQPEITSALEMAFRRQPFDVHIANSAKEGLEILSRTRIDAVISDEQMPVMSGSKFLSLVRQQYPDTVRIILSGEADMSATLRAINEAHAHHFLLKPCSIHDIALCVANALDERKEKAKENSAQIRKSEVARVEMLREFESAMDSLWMAFQPIVRAEDSSVFAHEALVRSDHPEMKTPELLFAAAQEFGRVQHLERGIWGSIAGAASDLRSSACLMVNLDPQSFGDEELYSVQSPLFAVRDRVIFEITERDKLEQLPSAAESVSRLRRLGYRVAVDDLGAGYAGLNSFALIQPDIVKFDMQLIRGIDTSSTKANLVRSITRLCKEMGVLTVAEGIETSSERDAVIDLGCDLLQGFHICRPARGFVETV